MFSGIVSAQGTIQKINPLNGGLSFFIKAPNVFLKGMGEGESICVSGVCLTMVRSSRSGFWVDLSSETLSKTFLGDLPKLARVNLERSLRFDDRCGGHFVTGHVDETSKIVEIHAEGEFVRMDIQKTSGPLVEKGSIAVDGVSLTIHELMKDQFRLMLIPQTLRTTTLGEKKRGDPIHLEFDMLGKYVQSTIEGIYGQNTKST